MGLLSLLFGCGSKTPYHKKDGQWFYDQYLITTNSPATFKALNKRFAKSDDKGYYRGESISGSDGKTFQAFSDHYASDKNHVYYCDTYRDGKEYFSIKHSNINIIDSADAASFIYLDLGYAKDKSYVFFYGKILKVKDPPSFEVLKYSFTRDKVTGYYRDRPIAGSIGSSFTVVDDHYSKDTDHVFFSDYRTIDNDYPSESINVLVENCPSSSFIVLYDGYATNKRSAFYNGKLFRQDIDSLKAIGYDYAKSGKEVFYRGNNVAGADIPTFVTMEVPTETADAKDKNSDYQKGKRVN